MDSETKQPPWLARRGYSARLKTRLAGAMKARRAPRADVEPPAGSQDAGGPVVVLADYRALRAAGA